MKDKCKTKKQDLQVHSLPAGLIPGDHRTELFGIRETRKVFALSNGRTIPFAQINPAQKAEIFELMLNDPAAMHDLRDMDHDAALEEFAFCMYGDADSTPDFLANGAAAPSENFRCSANCRCLAWKSKCIMLNGHKLTPHQVKISQALASDKPDKAIANDLNMAHSTLNTHKQNLFIAAGVKNKAGFVRKAMKHKVIQ